MRLRIALFCASVVGCGIDDEELVPLRSVEQAVLVNPDVAAGAAPGDYDNDGRTDISVKGSNGIWYIDFSANGFGGRWDAAYPGYGGSNATPVPADYDGDGYTDLSIKDTTGFWGVDYAWNGFGTWDVMAWGYGFSNAVPCPADYDGDGMADMSIKDSTGFWGIDYAANGFTGWNDARSGYGDSTWVPVPGKYDSDTKADRAWKNGAGEWYIDDSSNGYGRRLCTFCPLTLWDHKYTGYGNSSAIPNAADYDLDGHADLSVTGVNWYIDLWAPNYSFGAWDYPNWGYPGHYSATMTAVPGNYDGDQYTDLAWKDHYNGFWFIDYGYNGWTMSFPYFDQAIDTANRPSYTASQPYIVETRIFDPAGTQLVSNGAATLTTGVRYNVAVVVQPGTWDYNAGVEENPALGIPRALNLEDQKLGAAVAPITNKTCNTNSDCNPGDMYATHECNTTTHRCNYTRWFSVACSEAGSFPLGFQMRDAAPDDPSWPGTGNAFNPDYGVRVLCTSPAAGLSGRVTRRVLTNGVYQPGTSGVDGVEVSVPGFATVTTMNGGNWSISNVTGGPHRVTFTPPGGSNLSSAVAVNVTVPPGQGVRIDTPLDKTFTLPMGATYTTFFDYSRGRTIMHVVDINTQNASVKTDLAIKDGNGNNKTLVQTASQLGSSARVVVNGSYFVPGGAVGYFNSITSAPDVFGYTPSWVPDGAPGRMYQTTANGQRPRITLELARYGTGFAIPVWFEGLAGASDERVVLAPLGSPLSTVTAIGVPAGKRGTHTFPAVPPGTYVARVLRNNNTQLTAQSASFVVGRAVTKVRVATDSMYYVPGQGIVISYQNLPAGSSVGLVLASAPLTDAPIVSAAASGTSAVALYPALAAGVYEARSYAPDGSIVTSNSFAVERTIAPELTSPLLAISGTGFAQNVRIVQNTPADFLSNVDPWTMYGQLIPLYDTNPRDSVSDISFGFQCWPMLLGNGNVMGSEHPDQFRSDAAWARTAVGVSANHFFIVVADGEGIHGRHGATFNQLGEFFRDALFATDAMNFDGGLSTELVLWDATTGTPRNVNTITGEDGRIETNPYNAILVQNPGAIGSVDNFLRVGQ